MGPMGFDYQQGVLKRVLESDNGTEQKKQISISTSRKTELLQQLHDDKSEKDLRKSTEQNLLG